MPTVNSEIITWARESAGFSPEEAARKLGLADTKASSGVEKLSLYESGEKQPSRALLSKLAKQYRRPLLTFYLQKPPATAPRGEDYRTLQPDTDPAQNAIVDALVRNIRARQDILKEAIASEGGNERLPYIGSFDISLGFKQLADEIRTTCEIDLHEYRQSKTQEAAFKYLRTSIEKIGVFTILAGNLGSHHTDLDTSVFRGFALSDDIAPFVVINNQDSKTAWSFTLLHEVSHLWLGATGISGAFSDREIEKFCDEAASEILLPEEDINRELFSGAAQDLEELIKLIDHVAQQKKVSSKLVAFRLMSNETISQHLFNKLSKYFYSRWASEKQRRKNITKNKSSGPSYYVVKRHQAGNALLGVSNRLLRSGELSTTEVARVLGVRPLKVGNMLTDSKAA